MRLQTDTMLIAIFPEPIGRGIKKSIILSNLTLSALDHNIQSKGFITPSVCLNVTVPEDIISRSFYNGQVTVSQKDSVFEGANPFRDTMEMEHILRQNELKPILIVYSDGGPDHRLTYHSFIKIIYV